MNEFSTKIELKSFKLPAKKKTRTRVLCTLINLSLVKFIHNKENRITVIVFTVFFLLYGKFLSNDDLFQVIFSIL